MDKNLKTDIADDGENTGRPKIIVVDDQEAWQEKLPIVFTTMDIDNTFESIGLSPSEFYEVFSDAEKFNNVAACFLDLELTHGGSTGIGDTHGKDKALPFVAEKAPWVATACYSRFLDKATMVGEISLAGFDAIFPKEAFMTVERDVDAEDGSSLEAVSSFNSRKFKQYLRELALKRLSALQGEYLGELKRRLNLDVPAPKFDPATQEAVNQVGLQRFVDGLKLMGFEGTLGLDQVSPGFSSLNTSRLRVDCRDDFGTISSTWFLKWGTDINSLHKEITAHQRIVKRGLFSSGHLSTLSSNVLAWKGLGFIAYEFKGDCVLGSSFANAEDLSRLRSRLAPILAMLYKGHAIDTISPNEELEKWCGTEVAAANARCDTLRVTRSVLHGDLHLKNILTNSDDLFLIDFARSSAGPIAVDAAKLVSDIVYFGEDILESCESLTWDGIEKSALRPIIEMFGPYFREHEDRTAFEIFLQGYVTRYLSYPDVPEDRKKHARALLGP